MFLERFSILLVAILLFGAIGSYADTERIAGDGSGPPFRLLFVGNSIFFTNGGVNHVVAKLLQQHFPRVAIVASQVAEPNFLLRQHLEKAWRPGTHQYEALGINSTANWDFVIFQEESRQIAMGGEDAARSVEALKALTWLAHARGARVGVVQTWAWIDGRSKLWPTFEAMQDQINNATAGYMQAERQQEENVFLAPVGLGYEFVHDVVDLADFAHGQDRGAPVAERMLALVGNPYASILRLCNSKRNMMDTAVATSDSSPVVASTAANADSSDTARAFADSAWTAGQNVPGDAASDSNFGQTDSSASSRTARWNSNKKNSMESVESNKDALTADLQIESDVSKVAPSAIVGSSASSAWQQEQLHLKTKGHRQKRSDLNVCQASNLPAGNNTFMDLYWDELHPSREGTYLQGLIIASAMTGCRMAGVAYGFDLEPAWVPFLQSLSDAIVFYGTPKQYPSYSWATSGRSCVLGKSG